MARARETPLPTPPDRDRDSFAWAETERAFGFFNRGASLNRAAYLGLRSVVLVAGAGVPLAALSGAPAGVAASLGATVVIAEGLAQLFQVHVHWIRYRRTAEAIRREAFAFAAGIGPYGGCTAGARDHILAMRLLDVVGEESTKWEDDVRSMPTASPASPPDAPV